MPGLEQIQLHLFLLLCSIWILSLILQKKELQLPEGVFNDHRAATKPATSYPSETEQPSRYQGWIKGSRAQRVLDSVLVPGTGLKDRNEDRKAQRAESLQAPRVSFLISTPKLDFPKMHAMPLKAGPLESCVLLEPLFGNGLQGSKRIPLKNLQS